MASKTQIQQLNNNNQLETLHPETDADIVTVDNSSGHYAGSATNVQAALEELFGKNDYGYVEIDSDQGTLNETQFAECLKEFAVIRYGQRLLVKIACSPTDTGATFVYEDIRPDGSGGIILDKCTCVVVHNSNNITYLVLSSTLTALTTTEIVTRLGNKQNTIPTSSATIASESGGVVTIKAGVTQTNGAIGNSTGSDITLGTAAKKNTGTGSGNVPILDANGKLNESVLPALAITDTFTVASQSAMLALTAQVGDIAIRTDLNKCFILKTAGASTLANWAELKTPTDVVQSVNSKTGAVTLEAGDIKYDSSVDTNTIKDVVDNVKTDVSNLKGKFNSSSASTVANGVLLTDKNAKIYDRPIGSDGFLFAEITDGQLDVNSKSTIQASYIGDLPASKITSGTFDAARIPSLNASKITAGTFADARIASAATWNAKYAKPSGGIPSSDLADSGVTAGTYSAVQVNAKGLVTGGGQFIEVGTTGQTTPSASLAVGGLFFKKI